MAYHNISKNTKYPNCPRCKSGKLIEEMDYLEGGDIDNYFICNCGLHYYGDDIELFSLVLAREEIKYITTILEIDPDFDWNDLPAENISTSAVILQIEWQMKNNCCAIIDCSNDLGFYKKQIPLLPFDVSTEIIESLLLL